MRLLADTNIFISLEGNDVLSKSVADLARLTHSNGHKLMVHPASLEDIRRDSDSERQKINESKIRKYPFLESPPMLSPEEEMKLRLSANTPNDQVDNQILHAVAQNAVDILVTEDRRIHTKARALGVSGRVHYLQQAVEFLHRMHEGQAISLPSAIQTTPLHNIKVNIPFFNSLREEVTLNLTFGIAKWRKRGGMPGLYRMIPAHSGRSPRAPLSSTKKNPIPHSTIRKFPARG